MFKRLGVKKTSTGKLLKELEFNDKLFLEGKKQLIAKTRFGEIDRPKATEIFKYYNSILTEVEEIAKKISNKNMRDELEKKTFKLSNNLFYGEIDSNFPKDVLSLLKKARAEERKFNGAIKGN
ncbi:MAG: hypothetical protein V1824_00920 [archaeon]